MTYKEVQYQIVVSVVLQEMEQKNYHDHSCCTRYYEVGQNVQAYNFQSGPRWVAGIVVRSLGSFTS